MVDFTYQLDAANIIYDKLLSNNYTACCLAACPGSGKTTISHYIINKYINQFKHAKVLVLTEGQNLLKNQYINELNNPNIRINFDFGIIGSNKQVIIGIPQSIHRLQTNTIDLLIVDECHHFFLTKMDQDIIKKYQIKHIVIMTGSPSKFTKTNKNCDSSSSNNYFIHYIAAQKLIDKNVFSCVNLDILRCSDINNNYDILHNFFKKIKQDQIDITKIMIACKTIKQAQDLQQILTNKYQRKVSISTSINDSNNTQINKYKANITDTLLVVNKGLLGFNDSAITCLLDLKSSPNIEASYQLLARILRKHKQKDMVKNYIRISSTIDYNEQVYHLHKIKALLNNFNFAHFDGYNINISIEIV